MNRNKWVYSESEQPRKSDVDMEFYYDQIRIHVPLNPPPKETKFFDPSVESEPPWDK